MRVLDPDRAEDVADLVPDGATVAVCGNGSALLPDALLAAIERAFLARGRPRDLTLYYPALPGSAAGTGVDRLAHRGLVRAVVASAFRLWQLERMADLVRDDAVEAHCLPMGVAFQLLRAAAARQPGVVTRVGLDTFLDPGADGRTAMNGVAPTRRWVERLTLDGEAHLFYRSPAIDVALLQATAADRDGNLSLRAEPTRQAVLDMAMAAGARRGRVVAQVRYLVRRGSMPARQIDVPGFLVDAVLPMRDGTDGAGPVSDPALSGEWAVEDPGALVPLTPRKAMARRIALLLRPGELVNLGFGLPGLVGDVLAEEGVADRVLLSIEHGPIGGRPTGKGTFGAAVGPRYLLTSPDTFTLYHGGRLDWTILGAAEVDARGDVAVHRFGDAMPGPGGFVDIASSARRIVFATALTTGGARLAVRPPPDPGLVVEVEGRIPKFVPRLSERTFSAREALGRGAEVWYVTERAAFRLEAGGPTLVEIAPGLVPERDVLAPMGFRPRLAPALRRWPSALFESGPIGLARRWSSAR